MLYVCVKFNLKTKTGQLHSFNAPLNIETKYISGDL